MAVNWPLRLTSSWTRTGITCSGPVIQKTAAHGVRTPFVAWSTFEYWTNPTFVRSHFLLLRYFLLGFCDASSGQTFQRPRKGREAARLLGQLTAFSATDIMPSHFAAPLRQPQEEKKRSLEKEETSTGETFFEFETDAQCVKVDIKRWKSLE